MGPKDNFGNPYGGNLLTVARAELIDPDAGEIPDQRPRQPVLTTWATCSRPKDTPFLGRNGQTPVTYNFKFSNLRRSVGLSVEWLAPLGLFRFSYGVPLNASKGNGVLWPDEKERFQFSIGQAF